MTLNPYTCANCGCAATTTWTTNGLSGTCVSGASTSVTLSVKTGGWGAALPSATASPSPSPTVFPSASVLPSASASPAALPQKVALLGVFSDAACTALYPGVPRLDAVGTVGACSGLPGLGSGLITLANAAAQTFNVKGYNTGDGTGDRCGNTALAEWRSVPLGVCTKTTQPLPYGYGYVLLAPTVVINSVASSADCVAANTMYTTTVAVVGLGSTHACTALSRPLANPAVASVAVLVSASGGYHINGFMDSANCSGSPALGWAGAALGTCTNSAGAAASISLGGLASSAQSFYDPADAIAVVLTLPAGATSTLTLASMSATTKAELIGVVAYFLGNINTNFVTITGLSTTTSRRARALAAGYAVNFAVNAAAVAVALNKNGFPTAAVATAVQAALSAAASSGALATGLSATATVAGALGVAPTAFSAPGALVATAAASPSPSPTADDKMPLAVGLGVGLGVGIPVLLAALYFLGCLKLGVAKEAVPEKPRAAALVINSAPTAAVV
jgi:hypothetical protein